MTQPAKDSPQQKLLQKGAEALSNEELLAILLCRGARHEAASQLANKLLTQFGSLTCLLEAELGPFQDQMGRITVPYILLKASQELNRRYWCESVKTGGGEHS